MDLREAIQIWEEENGERNDGRTGVENLAKLAGALGYNDPMKFGQFLGGCYGDLIEFLEDNPGCVEAIKEWIAEQNLPVWVDSLGYDEEEVEDE